MGPLYRSRRFQNIVQVNFPSIISLDKSESIFFPVTGTRDHGSSREMGSGKGTRSGNSWLLFLAISCTKKERKVTSGNGRLDRCLPTCSDSSSISKVSSVHVRRSSLSVHGLTLLNGPESMDFNQTDGCYSIAHVSTCHLGISIGL